MIMGFYRDFEWEDDLYAVIKDNGNYAGSPCVSYGEAKDLSAQHEKSRIFQLTLLPPEDQVWDDYRVYESCKNKKKNRKSKLKENLDYSTFIGKAYLHKNKVGLMDEIETNDPNEAEEWAWQQVQNGLFVKLKEIENESENVLNSHFYSPDKFDEDTIDLYDTEISDLYESVKYKIRHRGGHRK